MQSIMDVDGLREKMGFDYLSIRNAVQHLSLNNLLDQLEVDVSRVGQGKIDVAQILLVKFDVAQQKIEEMGQRDSSVKAESAQFDYLVSELKKNAKGILHDLGGTKQLVALRRQKPSGPDYEWWYADKFLENQRKQNLKRILLRVGMATLLLFLAGILYNTFFKPDPAQTGLYTHRMNAEELLSQGDFQKALVETNQALNYAPSDSRLFVLRGVIYTMLNQQKQADQDFEAAKNLAASRKNYVLLRTQYWLGAGNYQKSLTEAGELIQEDPTSAEGFFYLGRANEFLGNFKAAIEAYETAANLADSQGKSELTASIRIMLAMLMQSSPELMPSVQKTAAP